MRSNNPARAVILGLTAGLLVAGAWQVGVLGRAWDTAAEQVARARLAVSPASPTAPLVMLVVYDTTRADHLSLCGYDRPTSPALQALVAKGAFHSCDARTPGSWTLPTHASYFTGLPVPEHGADNIEVPRSAAAPANAMHIAPNLGKSTEKRWMAQPLDPAVTTLAEAYKAKGYQTVAVSPNWIVSPELGLLQGFDHTVAVPRETDAEGRPFPGDPLPALARELAALDRDKPVFLYVNLFFAHDPWRGVPDDAGWVPGRPPLAYDWEGQDDPWGRYVRNEMKPDEKEAFRGHLLDVYDWGIRRDDDAFGALMQDLDDWGFTKGGVRLAVAADHGEMLGEKGLLQHGQFIHEGNTRVAVVLYDSAGSPAERPGRMNAVEVHDFLRDGQLPAPAPVVTYGLPMGWSLMFEGDRRMFEKQVAIWDGARKLVWHEGRTEAFDLAADPREERPLPTTPEEVARLEAEAAKLQRFHQGKAPDASVQEMLEAAGYLHRDPAGK